MNIPSAWREDLKRYPPRPFFREQSIWAIAIYRFGQWNDRQKRGVVQWILDKIYWLLFRITETMNFEFRTEFFNFLNHTNFQFPATTLNNALPTLSYNTSTGIYSASTSNVVQPGQAFTQGAAGATFGQLRSTVNQTVGLGTPRQIQFGFRFNF